MCSNAIDPNLAEQLILFSRKCGAQSVTLIGGEPTLHSDLLKIIRFAHSLGMREAMATNGIALADASFVEKLECAGLSSLGLSLKGFSPDEYSRNAGFDAYDAFYEAVENVASSSIEFAVTTVLSEESFPRIVDAVSKLAQRGANAFVFSFDFSPCDDRAGSREGDLYSECGAGRAIDFHLEGELCAVSCNITRRSMMLRREIYFSSILFRCVYLTRESFRLWLRVGN